MSFFFTEPKPCLLASAGRKLRPLTPGSFCLPSYSAVNYFCFTRSYEQNNLINLIILIKQYNLLIRLSIIFVSQEVTSRIILIRALKTIRGYSVYFLPVYIMYSNENFHGICYIGKVKSYCKHNTFISFSINLYSYLFTNGRYSS